MIKSAQPRSVEYYDMPAIRGILRDAAGDDYRFSSLVYGIVTSVPFQMRVKSPQEQRHKEAGE